MSLKSYLVGRSDVALSSYVCGMYKGNPVRFRDGSSVHVAWKHRDSTSFLDYQRVVVPNVAHSTM